MMRAASRAGLEMLRPSHLTVLRVLDPGTEGARAGDMARDADVSRQAIQQIVIDLESLGIVESVPDSSDGRARLVRYTAFGRRGYKRCMREFGRIEADLEAEIGARAMRGLKRTLLRIAETES